MSGARSVGGIRRTSGRRERPGSEADPGCSKEEIEQLRAGVYDMRRRRGEKTAAWDFGLPRRKKRVASGGAWRENFLKALERCGSQRHAAELAGVSYPTVLNHKRADRAFADEVDECYGRWAWRQLQYDAKSSRYFAAILAYVQRELEKAAARQNQE